MRKKLSLIYRVASCVTLLEQTLKQVDFMRTIAENNLKLLHSGSSSNSLSITNLVASSSEIGAGPKDEHLTDDEHGTLPGAGTKRPNNVSASGWDIGL